MNAKSTSPELDLVTSGAYRSAYLIYTRKSTDDAENQKNSIQYQKAETARFARAAGLSIAGATLKGFCTGGVIAESHSGFKEAGDITFGEGNTVQYRVERPKFHRLVQFLSEGRFKGVIVLCWDRVSRNRGDDTILRKLMKPGVDVRFVQAQYDQSSAGELHMDIDGMFAEHHSRVTREKVTNTIRAKRDEGYCTHKAPVGYLNEGRMEHKPFDPERSPIIRRLFAKADQATWSLSDLRRDAIEQGFTMPPARPRRTKDQMLADDEEDRRADMVKVAHLPTVTNIHYILTNPFYMGMVRGNEGTWVKSNSHEALVSAATFARVQEKLARRRTSIHYDKKLDHLFRGFLRCRCGRVYTPYEQKGITYYGARCDRSCPNPRKSVNLAFVCEAVGRLIDGLVFTDEELARIDNATNTGVASLEAKQVDAREGRERCQKVLREELAYLTDNRLTLLRTGAYTPQAFAVEESRVTHALTQTEEKRLTGHEMRETVGAVVKLSELLKTAKPLYDLAKPEQKERIARVTFSELSVFENIVQFRPTSGFRALERRILSEGALCDWLSELVKAREAIAAATFELEALAGLETPTAPASPKS